MEIKGTVSLEGIEFFARHGIYDFERQKGNKFWVDVYITKTYTADELTQLETTIDYEKAFVIIEKIMLEPEPLLETVAKKMLESLSQYFSTAQHIKLKIKKNKPPIANANVPYSAFEAEWQRP